MTGLAWGVLCLFGAFLFAAIGDLVSEEIRGWLDLVPRAILRLAAAQLDPHLWESIYEGEWLPDLIYELRGAESRPITRLVRGTTFALGLLLTARRITRCRTNGYNIGCASSPLLLHCGFPGGSTVKLRVNVGNDVAALSSLDPTVLQAVVIANPAVVRALKQEGYKAGDIEALQVSWEDRNDPEPRDSS